MRSVTSGLASGSPPVISAVVMRGSAAMNASARSMSSSDMRVLGPPSVRAFLKQYRQYEAQPKYGVSTARSS